MKNNSKFKILFIFLAVAFFVSLPLLSNTQTLLPQQELGKLLFFDQKLSVRNNQSCASCHGSIAGWTGPIPGVNIGGAVYRGSIASRFGNRKPPTVAYSGDSPVLYKKTDGTWVGGMFWDGRATGWRLGDPLAEQAQGPFLNPLEQALLEAGAVVDKVCKSKYSGLFKDVCGNDICDSDKVSQAYECIARSIAAYERSSEVSQFSSQYDAYLRGEVQLTPQEMDGLTLFNGKAMCSACHISDGQQPLFTDFIYDNLGVPRNPKNPFYFELEWNPDGLDWVDTGLGGFLAAARYASDVYELEWGKQKVPTLRNVDKRPGPRFVKAYGHNGYFKSLKGIVYFYNTRDVKPPCPDPFTTERDAMKQGCWPAPEVDQNVNTEELGNLGLTPEEENAIVAFLKTLSDGFTP